MILNDHDNALRFMNKTDYTYLMWENNEVNIDR